MEERVLEIAIALEVFYQIDGSELTYKLSTRAVHLLGSPVDRVDRFKTVPELYRNPSDIVHGTASLSRNKQRNFTEDTERVHTIG